MEASDRLHAPDTYTSFSPHLHLLLVTVAIIYFSMWNFMLLLMFLIFIVSHPLSFYPVAPLFLLTSALCISATVLYRLTHSDSSASPFLVSGSPFPCLVYSSTLKPEMACFFKMLEPDYQTARRHILEDSFIVTIMRIFSHSFVLLMVWRCTGRLDDRNLFLVIYQVIV